MASSTSCCGVKKQKLGNGTLPQSLSCVSSNGAVAPAPGKSPRACSSADYHCDDADEDASSTLNALAQHRTKVVNHDMVVYCFDVLQAFLRGLEAPKAPKSFPSEQFPLFVTWKLGRDKKLRGCIGTFNSTGLHHGLREYAITSACKDSRFDAISLEEFNRLHCSVSLLMDFEMADHYMDWEIGVHGIRIEFTSEKGSKKAATYLPEVAVEQGWDHVQTIDSLMRKGGFRGSITPDIRASVCVVRFQSDKLSVSYAEYVMHKEQRGEEANYGVFNGAAAPKKRGLFPSFSGRSNGRSSPSPQRFGSNSPL